MLGDDAIDPAKAGECDPGVRDAITHKRERDANNGQQPGDHAGINDDRKHDRRYESNREQLCKKWS